jgi:hypothetical protein
MSDFPTPPKSNRTMTPAEAPPQPRAHPKPEDILAPKNSRLTDDEAMFILKNTLTPSHFTDPMVLQFIMHYLENRNAHQAAKEAGFTSRQGYYLRTRPDIHAAIEALTAKAVMKFGYDASEVIERVKEIAGLDPIEFENPDGTFKTHLSQIAPESRRAIKKFKAKNIFGEDPNGMKTVIGTLIEVEFWDKIKSIELLGREKNIFKETRKVEHDVTSNMKDLLLGSVHRADQRLLTEAIDVTPEAPSDSE